MEFFSIGVYNSSESDFFQKLVVNKIDTFCDIRQRRGVRGARYSFVNSNKLQELLSQLEINYAHLLGLAPTTEIRDLQKQDDYKTGIIKSERQVLGEKFKEEFKLRILPKFDFDYLFDQLESIGAKRIVFFCVEEHHEACHRSIVTDWLSEKYNYQVHHL